jgi:hypothetical protein
MCNRSKLLLAILLLASLALPLSALNGGRTAAAAAGGSIAGTVTDPRGTASSDEDHRIFDITRHEMDCAIKGTQIAATDAVSFRPLVQGTRVIPFSLYGSLRVGRVRDSEGRDLNFIQEKKDKDADFAVIWPEQLETNKDYKVTIEYAGGDALEDLGGGNYYLGPRETWYPNNSGTQFGDRAVFDMTFRYPKGKTLIGTGELAAPESRDGDYAVAKWTSGDKELAVAGFNYGVFKKKIVQDPDTGYQIEFYANEDLPNFMEGVGVGSMSTAGMADSAIADAENATRIYDAYFGKLPYTRVAMTQQPAASFGQAWPTLVYMPFTAFRPRHVRLPPQQREDRPDSPLHDLPEGRIHPPHASHDDARPQDGRPALHRDDEGLHSVELQS